MTTGAFPDRLGGRPSAPPKNNGARNAALAGLALALGGAGTIGAGYLAKDWLASLIPPVVSADGSPTPRRADPSSTPRPTNTVDFVTETPMSVVVTNRPPTQPVSTQRPEASATTVATRQVETVQDMENLFTSKGTMVGDRITIRISTANLNGIGLDSVGLPADKLEGLREIILANWARAASNYYDDPRLDMFSGIDLNSYASMLNAYDQNQQLGNSGFDYVFNFGNGLAGTVGEMKISDVTSADIVKLSDILRKTGVKFSLVKPPSGFGMALFFFDSQGTLQVYESSVSKVITPGYQGVFLVQSAGNAFRAGEYAIGEVFKRGSIPSLVAPAEYLGCDTSANSSDPTCSVNAFVKTKK